MTRRAVLIAQEPTNGDDVPEDYIRCDPIHITRIEPLGKRARRTNRKPRQK